MTNIALISPHKEVYSETFIKAHKDLLSGNIFYYYGGFSPTNLEDEGNIIDKINIFTRAFRYYRYGEKNPYNLALKQSLKKNKIDVVLAEYGPTGNNVLSVCKSLKIPLIVHFHGYDAHRLDILNKYGVAYRELFKYCSSIIAVSEYMRQALITLGANKEKIILNPYGPNKCFSQVCPNPKNSQKIISIGRFVDKKAPYYNILVFKEIIKKYPAARLVMVGDGPLLNTCINLAKLYGLSKNIVFPGILTTQKIIEELADVRFFIQNSIVALDGDSEGTPVGILEAQAAGIPVLSTKHAGIVDAVIDGETGFLAEEHDIGKMLSFALHLLEDDSLVEKMSIKAKQHIHDNYSIKKHIEVIDNLIKYAIHHKTEY